MSANPVRLHLLALLLVATLLHLWGIEKMLPVIPDTDEGTFVGGALKMLTSGELNPGFFGHPGSTTVYPLALFLHLWRAAVWSGSWLGVDSGLADHLAERWWEYYLLGRYLSTAYNLAALPLVFLIGRRAFNPTVGVAGAWLCVFYSAVVFYARMVRTDTAGLFWGLLALYFVLRMLNRPSLGNQLLAGGAIGLAAASRYFLGVIGVVLLLVDGVILARTARDPSAKTPWARMAAGLLIAPLVFLAATPYLVLDMATALADLRAEARVVHLGADGLSPLGNIVWYLTVGIPESITWPQWVAALVGIGFTLGRKRLEAGLLLVFCASFVALISLSALHWHRWLIPTLPILALFAASGAYELIGLARRRWSWSPRLSAGLFAVLIVLMAVWPAQRLIVIDIRQANGNTRLIARHWMMENLPTGSRILQEAYAAPLGDAGFQVVEGRALVDDPAFALAGFDYLVASSAIYDRFFVEPERYAAEIDFYRTLFDQGKLVYKIEPTYWVDGPTIVILEP
jgi:hypothetical protein